MNVDTMSKAGAKAAERLFDPGVPLMLALIADGLDDPGYERFLRDLADDVDTLLPRP